MIYKIKIGRRTQKSAADDPKMAGCFFNPKNVYFEVCMVRAKVVFFMNYANLHITESNWMKRTKTETAASIQGHIFVHRKVISDNSNAIQGNLTKRVREMSSQLFVTLYIYIYPSAYKQLRRHLSNLFSWIPLYLHITLLEVLPNVCGDDVPDGMMKLLILNYYNIFVCGFGNILYKQNCAILLLPIKGKVTKSFNL